MTTKATARVRPSVRAVEATSLDLAPPTSRLRAAAGLLFPQVVRTILAASLWLGLTNIYVGLISPYSVYFSAQTMTVGLIISSAVVLHLWPPRTAPWRTLAWTAFLTASLGATLLTLGLGRHALSIVTIVAFGFVALRTNQTGRHLVGMFRTWRDLR